MMNFSEGDTPPSNRWYNAVLAGLKRSRVVAVGSGLARSGRSLARLGDRRMWAMITGDGPAYGFMEATPGASGGFDLVAGGRTDAGGLQPAYEANGVAGLAGSVQRLAFSTVDDWRFREIYAAHSGAPPECISLGLGSAGCAPDCIPIYTVTNSEGTTFADVHCLPVGDTYTVTSDAGMRFVDVDATFGPEAGGFVIGITIADGYLCCPACLPADEEVPNILPISRTLLYVSDGHASALINLSTPGDVGGGYAIGGLAEFPCGVWSPDGSYGTFPQVYILQDGEDGPLGWFVAPTAASFGLAGFGPIAGAQCPTCPDYLNSPVDPIFTIGDGGGGTITVSETT